MGRINTNVSSLIAQRVLGLNQGNLGISLERLSTGLRINRGKDDPAGLIASENLRAEKKAVNAAIGNAERADQVVSIAEGGLQEISELLTEVQGLLTQTASTGGISPDERRANQLQVDSILQTIDRIASATSFQGLKLLNGNQDYVTESISPNIAGFSINAAKLAFGETRDVDVVVTGSAQVGGFLLSFGAAALDLGAITDKFVVEVAGSRGSRELSFASGTTVADIVAAVNSFTQVTGVAAAASGTGAVLTSTGFGSAEFVSVRVIDDGSINTAQANAGVYGFEAADTGAADAGAQTLFSAANNKITDEGQDVQATINGIAATTNGTVVRINTDFLDVEVDLKTGTSSGAEAQRLGAVTAFTITGGGAAFQLGGRVDIGGEVNLGIPNFAVRNTGRTQVTVSGSQSTHYLADIGAGRALNLVDGNLNGAQEVLSNAIKEVTSLRGRLGAFQSNVIGSTVRSLGIALENTTAAESVIRDTDFADETSKLTRAQVLVSAAASVLTIANASPQTALQLLG